MSTAKAVSAYRLVKRKWASNAFDGEGAKRYGGRWNSRGKSCIYLSSAESLAMLEIMVHLQNYQLLGHYALFELSLPRASILHLNQQSLPEDWQEDPAPADTAAIGDDWLVSGKSLALAVPSTVVPREYNYLVNPRHGGFKALLKTAHELVFTPDARLTKTVS